MRRTEEDFDGRRTEYTRDPGGRVVETKKPDGVRLAYTYDRTNTLTSIKGYTADDPGNSRPLCETHYWYDRRGLLIRASNQAGLVKFERDGNGRIVGESVNGRKVEASSTRAAIGGVNNAGGSCVLDNRTDGTRPMLMHAQAVGGY